MANVGSFEYFRQYFRKDVKRGIRVQIDFGANSTHWAHGKLGRVTRVTNYVYVKLDESSKYSRQRVILHPKDFRVLVKG